jgi:4-diphosphocytidyl-2-C-methyl-D-erythritol kinase
MLTFPPAKLNLGLFVTGKRADGYHALESVFVPIGWTDALEAVAVEGFGEMELEVLGRAVPGGAGENLVERGYREVVAEAVGPVPSLRVQLVKALPTGAGLGGGSSDGTWMLRMLRDGFGVTLRDGDWSGLAAKLGSDCPFFLGDGPAWVGGRGEVVEPWGREALPQLRGRHVAVVHPGVHVGTREAFAGIVPRPAPMDLRELGALELDAWQGRVWNDFEPGIVERVPEVGEALELVEAAGAVYRSMTGSGSAVYGVFEDAAGARRAEDAGRDRGWDVWSGPL